MLHAIIFLICFVLLGVFVLWLSKNVEHGEARFRPDGKMDSTKETDDE